VIYRVFIEQGSLYPHKTFIIFTLLNLYQLAITVPQTVRPTTSKSLVKTPYHLSKTVLKIFLIRTSVYWSIRPIEFPYTMHTSLLPLTTISLTSKPCVCTLSIKLIIFEISSVTF
jgi:hypothetical protein